MIKIQEGKLTFNVTEEQKKKIIIANLFLGFVVVVLLNRKFFYDPDGYWHIRTGQWILENRLVPRFDTFSWYGIEHNLTWLNHEWLFDALIYLIYKTGGLSLVVWSIAFFSGILFVLVAWFLYIRNKNIYFSLIISLLSSFALQAYIHPRPQVISFCLLVAACILMEKKKWYFVIPIMILEANLHGGFWPLFIVVITFYAYKEKPILVLLSIIAVLVTPYGLKMYFYTFKNQLSPLGAKYISEAFKTRMANGRNIPVLISYALLIITTHNKKIKWQEGLFVFAIGALTFMAERHVVFAYLLIIPILSPYLLATINSLLELYGQKKKLCNL